MYGMYAMSMETPVVEESTFAKLTIKELMEQASASTEIMDFILMLIDEKEIKKKEADELIEFIADWMVDLQDEYYLRE